MYRNHIFPATTKRDCQGCPHHVSRMIHSGRFPKYEHRCLNPLSKSTDVKNGSGVFIGTNSETPKWCPFLGEKTASLKPENYNFILHPSGTVTWNGAEVVYPHRNKHGGFTTHFQWQGLGYQISQLLKPKEVFEKLGMGSLYELERCGLFDGHTGDWRTHYRNIGEYMERVIPAMLTDPILFKIHNLKL